MFANKFITCSKQINFFAFYSSSASHLNIPFIDLYERTTGQLVTNDFVVKLKKKCPHIMNLTYETLNHTLNTISKYSITKEEACLNPHIFCMNAISMENYGDILTECCFTRIVPLHIIRYHTLVKSRTISRLKKEGLLKHDLNLEEVLHQYFADRPSKDIIYRNFPDSNTNIVTVRMNVLEQYLQWKLNITTEQFNNYCRHYLPLRHRPMCDIQESLNIAQNNIKFDVDSIRRNGFIISVDPINTKLILENVDCLGGLDIREAIKIEPAILKNNYQSLLEIRNTLEEFKVSQKAQQCSLKVYCMHPQTVRERLEHITSLKEYKFLSTNSRMLYMVIHEKKMMTRLSKLEEAKKQCFSLNHLVSSNKIFNTYINSFGDRTCGSDMGMLIVSCLQGPDITKNTVLNKLRRHKYWLHTALSMISENLHMLTGQFKDQDIFDNCQVLLYPISELNHYMNIFTQAQKGQLHDKEVLDASYNNVNFSAVTDKQLLSLLMYEIEKRFHFSGDGIWSKTDTNRVESQERRRKQSV